MKKVLIMSASTGGGHNKAANAIKNTLENNNIECEIIDSLKLVNSTMDRVISKGYEKSAMYTPKAYGKVYKLSDINLISRNEFKGNPLAKIMAYKFKKLLRKKSPDLIIGTHPFPMIALSDLKKHSVENRTSVNIPPLISLLTDYTTHSTWIQNEIDYYIVANEFVKELLIYEGVNSYKIKPFGIPVESSFFENREKSIVFEELELNPNKFTILLMGGSFGAGSIKEALEDLLNIDNDFQIIVITGKNEHLKEKLQKINTFNHKKVCVLGYTNNMNDLLSHVDLLISKPGGLTITEALIKNTPMVIPYCIPGQEEENLDFLTNSGVALRTTKKFTLGVIVKFLINNLDRLNLMRENINYIKKANSTSDILSLVNEIINKNE